MLAKALQLCQTASRKFLVSTTLLLLCTLPYIRTFSNTHTFIAHSRVFNLDLIRPKHPPSYTLHFPLTYFHKYTKMFLEADCAAGAAPPVVDIKPDNRIFSNDQPRACILAMARATPPFQIDQTTYADFYFDNTNTSHKTELKKKFTRICERSGISTRYSILTEKFLRAHPEFYTPGQPSMEERNAIFAEEVPKLAHEAATKAIQEWGRPVSQITHLIVATLTGIAIPGADVALVKSLGLRADVNRVMLYMLGCYAGVTALRVAKDLAESNPSSRILICCSELAAPTFRAPNEAHPYDLVGTALFGDGASGVIVGALPQPKVERPLYEIHWAGEMLVPDTEKIIEGKLRLEGLQFYLDRSLPSLVGKNVAAFCRNVLAKAPKELGFNDVFWAVHSGGPAILNAVEQAMELKREKLEASREILANYGNVSASTVLFVLDELRRSNTAAQCYHDGDCEWGVAVAFGPGVTMEGALLKRAFL